jgi:MoaA/NifB/PqqE/SkfB family radical SAM enzyme
MTGGEPLLYPRFVELASLLAHRHQLSINTNLSTDNVHEFASSVPVRGVYVINATAHIQEQEKRGEGLRRFIDRALFLQDKGFRIRIMYITYPPLLDRMTADMKMFAAAGITECAVKVFRGGLDGKSYPGAYTPGQKAFIRSHRPSLKEQAILDGSTSFRGRRCMAGHRAFYMDIAGNLTRCCTIPTGNGNLFQQNCRFDEAPGLCPARECICPYQGLKFAAKRQRLRDTVALLAGRACNRAAHAARAILGK